MKVTTAIVDYHVEASGRADGGLRAWSDDVPHLVLSSKEREKLLADIPTAFAFIANHMPGVVPPAPQETPCQP